MSLHDNWKRLPGTFRKPTIFLLGFMVVFAGLVMLLIPGPGWAAIFLGFAILATEFAFAERIRDQLIAFLKAVINRLKALWDRFIHRSKHKHK